MSANCTAVSVSVAEHKRFVQLLDMRFKDINAYMNEMSVNIDKYLQVPLVLRQLSIFLIESIS